MKFAYDPGYIPPAPSMEIRLGLPGGPLRVGPLRAFVDTGADASLVPLRVIETLEAQVNDQRYARGQWGERRRVDVYLLDVGVGNVRVSPVEVAADDAGDEVVVGRNVLNRLIMILNGPQRSLEIVE